MADKKKNLFYLDELSNYKVSDDDPDIRGWKVKDADNRIIGKVDNLLVNKNTEKVVYIDVDVDESIIEEGHESLGTSAQEGTHEFINEEGENHVIVPIGMVRLDKDDKTVFTNEISHSTFAKTNRFRRGTNIDREYENYVVRHYSDDETYQSSLDDSLYNRKEFENRLK